MKDKEKERLLPNAILSALQVIVTGLTLFFLYGYLVRVLGIDAIGMWSLIVASTSVARISELGLSGSALRYVSKYLALNNKRKAADALQTATITIAILFALLVVIILPAARHILSWLLKPTDVELGLQLLPYGLASLWLVGIAACIQAGLDGCHRADLRSIATIAASLLHLGLVVLLVPKYGLFGLAAAQILQGGFLVGLVWLMVRRTLTPLPIFPIHWSKSAFLEMWRYGTTYQLTGIVAMLVDPTIKILLTSFGSLANVGYYEMAYKMVSKVESLAAVASRVFVPYISKLFELSPEKIPKFVARAVEIMFAISSMLFGALIAFSPFISVLWIGQYEATFVLYAWLLIIGHFVISITFPVYHANMGMGKMMWNLSSRAAAAVVGIITGLLLGLVADTVGVVLGYVTGLLVGGVILIISGKMWINQFNIREILLNIFILFSACMTAILMNMVLFFGVVEMEYHALKFTIGIFIYILLVLPAFWYFFLRNEAIRKSDF